MKRAVLSLLVVSVFCFGIMATGCGRMIGVVDTTPPTVSFVVPTNAATGVSLNQKIAATFSKTMDPNTINTTTFTLIKTAGGTAVAGTVTYVGLTAVFTPAANLTANTAYTATITTGAKDLVNDNPLAAAKTWSFVTGSTTDTTAPTVSTTSPADLDTNVALNKKIGATFSEAMDPNTISTTTFTLKQGTTVISGTVAYAGLVATFTPSSPLTASTTYTASITTGATDLAGNAMAAAKTWSFTTGTGADTTAPTVSSTIPADLATGVSTTANLTATFSEAMDPTTINTGTFTLMAGTTSITGTVSFDGLVATFSPTSALTANTVYVATVTTGAQDLAGNALAANKVWSFTTQAGTAAGPATVVLGTAGNFAILSKSGIALAADATATVNGDIGVSPAAATLITNASLVLDVPSGGVFATSTQVPGHKVYAANYAAPTPANMTTAINDMTTAYNDAAGRSNPTATELGSGNIGGMTLAPGLYKWSTGLLIPTDVFLAGGANDTWIFEVAQNLTVSNGVKIHLTGGALAKNVFWQISGHATLGTTSVMNGNMICLTDMTMNTGSTLNGRLLAQTAVTLGSGTIVNLP